MNKKLSVFILLCTSFIGLVTPQSLIIVDGILVYCILTSFKSKGRFKNLMYAILLLYICSIFSCSYFEGQSIYYSITSMENIMFLPFFSYFYLLKNKKHLNVESIEKTLNVFYIIIASLFIIHYIIFPKKIVQMATFYVNEHRFTLYGQSLTILFYYYYLNRFLLFKRIRYLLMMFPALICILIQGFRTYIIAIILTTLFFIVRTQTMKNALKIVFGLAVLGAIAFVTPVAQRSLGNMIERQESGASFDNEDYIRLNQFRYFTKEHFKNNIEYFFGSGLQNPRSDYGKRMMYLQATGPDNDWLGPIGGWRDWGMIGLSWEIGVATIMCIFYCIFVVLKTKIPIEYHYIKYFYLFIILTCFTTVEFYRTGSIFIHGVLFFLLELVKRRSQHLGLRIKLF